MAEPSGIDTLSSLLQLFHGKTETKTGGGTTEGKVIDSATLQGLLKSALESNSGLASIASGQQGAGLYNSSTNQLMTNDLLARLTVNTAAAAAPTVKTVNPTVTQGNKIGSQDILGLIGAGLLKKGYNKLGVDKKLDEFFSGFGDTSLGAGADAMKEKFNSGSQAEIESSVPLDVFGPTIDEAGSVGNISGSDLVDGASGIDVSSALSGADNFFGSAEGGIYGSDLVDGASGIDGAVGGIPYLSILSKSADGNFSAEDMVSVVGGYGGAEIGAELGTAIFPGVGTAIGGILGGMLGSSCFITTAVCEYTGKLDNCEELTKLRTFRDDYVISNHPESVSLYYATAPGIVASLKAVPDAERLFTSLYLDYIVPAIAAIDSGDFASAYEIYTHLYLEAKRLGGV